MAPTLHIGKSELIVINKNLTVYEGFDMSALLNNVGDTDDEKAVSFQCKREGRRGKMFYVVYIKGPKTPLPYQMVAFDNRADAHRLMSSFVEFQGFKRVSVQYFLRMRNAVGWQQDSGKL